MLMFDVQPELFIGNARQQRVSGLLIRDTHPSLRSSDIDLRQVFERFYRYKTLHFNANSNSVTPFNRLNLGFKNK